MPQTKRTIKKYPNRRLYDTEISSYITLEEVRQLVLDGEDFEVRDAKSGKDLTRSVLLQIIAEHEEHGQPMLSTPLLTGIIGFYDDPLQGLMGPYLEQGMQMFLDQQPGLRKELAAAREASPSQTLEALIDRQLEWLRTLQDGLSKDAGSESASKSRTGTADRNR
jgi:polyhydroxyalkanoate synthesis repressor PhaR